MLSSKMSPMMFMLSLHINSGAIAVAETHSTRGALCHTCVPSLHAMHAMLWHFAHTGNCGEAGAGTGSGAFGTKPGHLFNSAIVVCTAGLQVYARRDHGGCRLCWRSCCHTGRSACHKMSCSVQHVGLSWLLEEMTWRCSDLDIYKS